MKVLKNLFQQNKYPIIQFSPPRSGSTLVWNVLKTVFPNHDVQKKHSLTEHEKSSKRRSPIVATVRNPFDSIASSILRYADSVDDKAIQDHIDEFNQNGMRDILQITNSPNCLILKYESFYSNFEYLFDEIERFFATDISRTKRDELINELNIDEVSKRVQQLGDFDNYDPGNYFHGRHISEFKGGTGYYKQLLRPHDISLISREFAEFITAFEYSVDRESRENE